MPIHEQPSWFRAELGVNIGEKGRKRALLRRKQLSPLDTRKGRKSTNVSPLPPDGWIWDTVAVDLHELDLERALVVFERSRDSDALVGHLRQTLGVVEVVEMYGNGRDRRVVARVIYTGARRRSEIDEKLREAGVGFEWWSIRREAPNRPFESSPAAETWAALARQLAEIEGHAA